MSRKSLHFLSGLALQALAYQAQAQEPPIVNNALSGVAISEPDYQDSVYHDVHIGLDHWNIKQSDADASTKNHLQLPNRNTEWPYRDTSPWITAHVIYPIIPRLKFTAKTMANQNFGGRLDELSIDYSFSQSLGVRGGVVDYKMSWCKDYEAHTLWIQDPNEFCSDAKNKALTSAAPGLQAYINHVHRYYRIQSLIGIYNPKAWGYADFENGRRESIKNPTNSNHKYGASVDILNMKTGDEYRISWLHSDITEEAYYSYKQFSEQHGDTLYLALQTGISDSWIANISTSKFRSSISDAISLDDGSTSKYINQSIFEIQGVNASVTYTKDNIDKYTFGFSRSITQKSGTFPLVSDSIFSTADIEDQKIYQYVRNVFSVAWVHEFDKNFSTAIQFMRTVLNYSNEIVHSSAATASSTDGNALGMRIAYRF